MRDERFCKERYGGIAAQMPTPKAKMRVLDEGEALALKTQPGIA